MKFNTIYEVIKVDEDENILQVISQTDKFRYARCDLHAYIYRTGDLGCFQIIKVTESERILQRKYKF